MRKLLAVIAVIVAICEVIQGVRFAIAIAGVMNQ